MFFPIFIGPAPTGKLGIVYGATLLAVCWLVYSEWVKPILDYEFTNNPRFQISNLTAAIDPTTLLLWQGVSILIAGTLCVVIGCALYKNESEAH